MIDTIESNVEKVFRVLSEKPTYRFHIRELARATGLNPNTIINITNQFKKEEIVKKEKKKHLVEISLNLDDKKILQKRRISNISKIYSSGLVEFLIKKYNPYSITLMGSYFRGEDIEKSDIDIVVDTSNKKIIELSKFEKILKRKIHLLILPKKISKEFFNNLINGITLYGVIRNDIF